MLLKMIAESEGKSDCSVRMDGGIYIYVYLGVEIDDGGYMKEMHDRAGQGRIVGDAINVLVKVKG